MNFLTLFTPINISEERERFFSSSSYNPQFQYDRDLTEVNEYINKHPSKKVFAQALISKDAEKITLASKEYFQTDISIEISNEAKKILANGYKIFDNLGNDSQGLYNGILEALKYFKIDYKVAIIDSSGFNVRPSHKYQTVLISKYADLGLISLDTAVKHEMTHIIRFINKEYKNTSRSKNNLPTEEGFASYVGDTHSKDGFNSLFHHAAEYIASEIGLKGSLRDIYNYFISLKYSKEFSWQRAIRHKFGFIDTSMAGDIMKPGMYFLYETKISKLPKGSIIKLFSGKVSLEDINKIIEYTGFVPKDKLVEYFNL